MLVLLPYLVLVPSTIENDSKGHIYRNMILSEKSYRNMFHFVSWEARKNFSENKALFRHRNIKCCLHDLKYVILLSLCITFDMLHK